MFENNKKADTQDENLTYLLFSCQSETREQAKARGFNRAGSTTDDESLVKGMLRSPWKAIGTRYEIPSSLRSSFLDRLALLPLQNFGFDQDDTQNIPRRFSTENNHRETTIMERLGQGDALRASEE